MPISSGSISFGFSTGVSLVHPPIPPRCGLMTEKDAKSKGFTKTGCRETILTGESGGSYRTCLRGCGNGGDRNGDTPPPAEPPDEVTAERKRPPDLLFVLPFRLATRTKTSIYIEDHDPRDYDLNHLRHSPAAVSCACRLVGWGVDPRGEHFLHQSCHAGCAVAGNRKSRTSEQPQRADKSGGRKGTVNYLLGFALGAVVVGGVAMVITQGKTDDELRQRP